MPARPSSASATSSARPAIALVGIASAAADETTYWQCMESIDAADESRDRVLEMLRKLAAREAAGGAERVAG